MNYRTKIKKIGKKLIKHGKQVIREGKNLSQSQLFEKFFFDLSDNHLQGDVLETFGDSLLASTIIGKFNITNVIPSDEDQDRKQKSDSLAYKQDTGQRTGVQYKNTRVVKIHGAKGIENTILFLAESTKKMYDEYDPPGFVKCLVTSAYYKDCEQLYDYLSRDEMLCREEWEPLISIASIKEWIKFIESALEFFKKAKEEYLNNTVLKDPHDYQLEHKKSIIQAFNQNTTIDEYIRIGQGGGKTDMQADFCYEAIKRGYIAIYVAPHLPLIDQQITEVLPLIEKQLPKTQTLTTQVFSSRKAWSIEKDGFDVESLGALDKLSDEDQKRIFMPGGKLWFSTYHQLENLVPLIKKFKLEKNVVWCCDEIASKCPRIERINEDDKDHKHWNIIKQIHDEGIFAHKSFWDANRPEGCKIPQLGKLAIDIPQSELLKRGITIPIDPYLIIPVEVPKELLKIKGLNDAERKNVGAILRVIQKEVKLLKSNQNCDSAPGIVYWHNAKHCRPVAEFCQTWADNQNFDVPVTVMDYTSYIKSKDVIEENKRKWSTNPGVTILVSKRMLNRGINNRRAVFELVCDIINDEEASHRYTRINRTDDRDIIGEPKKFKPRARLYSPDDEFAENTLKILEQLQYADLDIRSIIVDEKGSAKDRKIPVKELMEGNNELAKQVEGTAIEDAYKLQQINIKKRFEAQQKAKAKSLENAKKIADWLFTDEKVDVTV